MKDENYKEESKQHLLELLQQLTTDVSNDSTPSFKESTCTYEALMQRFIDMLYLAEKEILHSALKNQHSIYTLTRAQYDKLVHLKPSKFLMPFGKNRYFISPELINFYNQHYLNNQFETLPELNSFAEKTIHRLTETEKHCRSYETKRFKDCIAENIDAKTLEHLCKITQINDYESLTHEDKCAVLSQKILNDFDLIEKLIKNIPPIRVLFSLMVFEDRNSYTGAEVPGKNRALFFLFSNPEYDILYLPIELFEQLKHFFKTNNINPMAVLTHTLKDFTGKELEPQKEKQWITDLCQNRLTDIETETLLNVLTKDYVYAEILDRMYNEEKSSFFINLISVYGFLPLSLVTTLYNRFFEADETSSSIKALISKVYFKCEYALEQGYLANATIQEVIPELDMIYVDIPYYIPESLEELDNVANSYNYFEEADFLKSYDFLMMNVNVTEDMITDCCTYIEVAVIEDFLLPQIKMLPREEDIEDCVNQWKLDGLFKGIPAKTIIKHITVMYNTLNLWSLRGYTRKAYQALTKQNGTASNPTNIIDLDEFI